MRIGNFAQPDRIILLCPWLDITLKNPEIREIDPYDPFLGISGLRKAGRMYAGGSDPESYLLSPINGPLDGLANISILMGSRDILAADARKLTRIASSRDVSVSYREYEEMVHAWMFLNFPESRMAQDEIVDLINE